MRNRKSYFLFIISGGPGSRARGTTCGASGHIMGHLVLRGGPGTQEERPGEGQRGGSAGPGQPVGREGGELAKRVPTLGVLRAGIWRVEQVMRRTMPPT